MAHGLRGIKLHRVLVHSGGMHAEAPILSHESWSCILNQPKSSLELCRFKLHSVLVHSGGMHGGHYYSYSRTADNRWLKFDDDKVGPLCICLSRACPDVGPGPRV